MINLRALGLLLLTLAAGCTAPPRPEPQHRRPAPATGRYESFGQVRVMNVGRHVDCLTLLTQEPCDDATIDALRPVTTDMTGSSMVIAHASGRSYVLTADHVCSSPNLPDTTVFPRGSKVILTQLAWETQRVVVDIEGVTRSARPVISDGPNDICVMEVEGVWGRPVPLSPRPPEMGETAYNIAAPAGIFDAGMVPIFVGIYSGASTSISSPSAGPHMSLPVGPGTTCHLYTFPSRPGSSGSAVLSPAGEVVGVVHSTVTTVPGLSISASWEAVRGIYRRLEDFISSR